jgi:asparagine synthase (glutamine-hydrolysing)
MKDFLAVTFAPHASERLRHAVAEASSRLGGDAVAVQPVQQSERSWVAFAGVEGGDIVTAPGGFTARIGRAARTRDRDVPTVELAAMMADGAALTDVLPPFAAAHRDHADGPLLVATDWLGFHQIYWWRGDGAAAVSTSARALATLAGGGFDPAGLGAQAMIGWHVGDATLFAGVRTVPPATIATLDKGTVHLRRYVEPPARPERAPALDDAVEEMATILGHWQSRYLEDHPDAVLQLTGGHDSRILLAAVPDKLRPGLRALTLGVPSSPDVAIAARLSADYGLRHEVYRLDEQRQIEPEEAHRLALTAARALECQASPLALAPLMLAESHLEQGRRLAGLGGEVARGFYYAGQPTDASTSPQLVERLARWRLFSNEAVEEDALDPAFLAEARAGTLTTLKGLFPAGDWLRATDEFYLFHRMHRWAGVHGTVAAVRRHYINPMFDRRFVELALAVEPADKRDSLLLGRLMTRLDAELAAIPLDSGLTPARLGTRTAYTRLATRALTARKVVRKVRQRLTHARKAQLGAAEMSALVLAHWRAEPAACRALYDAPVLRAEWLDALLTGATSAEPTTVAFLVDLLAATHP